MKGIVHSFESLAAVDGAGLRFAVFLAGCPLRCVCCHNPDTWKCEGREMDAAELVKKLFRYKPYFGDNGGATFSGGEPLLQASFLCEVIPLLQKEGIGYVVDTSGSVPLTDEVKTVLRDSQEVLLDLKFWDDDSSKRYTGSDLTLPMKTLDYLNEIGKKTILRTVIIPDINDSEEILDRYLSLLEGISCISKYELLPFHTMGFFKYENLGIENPLFGKSALSRDLCNRLQAYADENMC